MVQDGKSQLVTAWSLVWPTSHRVDTHMHAHTICKTGIADTKVSKSYVLVHFLKRPIARNVAQRRLKLWWPESECASVFVSKKWRLQQDCKQVMERAPRQMCAAIFKKKNVVGEKASKSAYDNLYPPILKLNPLKIWNLGKEARFCCSVTHARYAQTCIAETLSIKILCARSVFF